MKSSNKKPILVTGIHRSGSTWVGKMLGLASEIGYIHEPFNRNSGISRDLFKTWFTYINDENEEQYRDQIENYISFKYPFLNKLKKSRSARDVGRSIRDFSRFSLNRAAGRRPLVKDPISIFSAEWLYKTFDMDVIILTRHPAAFAGSIKKAGWRSGMGNYLKQPLLIRDHLKEFEEELKIHAEKEMDLVDEAILLWNMVHSVILKYHKKQHRGWYFVKHEDISKDPVTYFEEMYNHTGLAFTGQVREKIEEYSFGGDASNKLKRDSKANIYSWKKRLTEEEISRVKLKTGKISGFFYSDDEW